MYVGLGERNIAAAGFEFFLELSRQVPTEAPLVFLLAPGPDDQIDG